MSDTKELIERLRDAAGLESGVEHFLEEAADTIARLEAERDAARRDAMKECAALLEAEHAKRSHLDNHAAVYARMIREHAEKL